MSVVPHVPHDFNSRHPMDASDATWLRHALDEARAACAAAEHRAEALAARIKLSAGDFLVVDDPHRDGREVLGDGTCAHDLLGARVARRVDRQREERFGRVRGVRVRASDMIITIVDEEDGSLVERMVSGGNLRIL